MRPGCTPVSSQLCFCSHPNNYLTTLEPLYPTFTTALPNATTTLSTTTTTTTTTTVAPTACQTCTFADIVLVNGTLPGEFPVVPAGIQVVDGCSEMTVICASNDPNIDVFMEVSFEILILLNINDCFSSTDSLGARQLITYPS